MLQRVLPCCSYQNKGVFSFFAKTLHPKTLTPAGARQWARCAWVSRGLYAVRAAGCSSVQGKVQQLLTQCPNPDWGPHMLPFQLQPDPVLLVQRGHAETLWFLARSCLPS